jgi:hypothetical protein
VAVAVERVPVAKIQKVYKHILPTSNLQLPHGTTGTLIRAVSLDDQQILILTSGSLVALEMTLAALRRLHQQQQP